MPLNKETNANPPLDEVVYVSLHANVLKKGMNPSVRVPSMVWFGLVWFYYI